MIFPREAGALPPIRTNHYDIASEHVTELQQHTEGMIQQKIRAQNEIHGGKSSTSLSVDPGALPSALALGIFNTVL